jgi:hypothetical protein
MKHQAKPRAQIITAFLEFLSHPPLWSGVRFTRETLICSTRMARQVCDDRAVTNLGTAVINQKRGRLQRVDLRPDCTIGFNAIEGDRFLIDMLTG